MPDGITFNPDIGARHQVDIASPNLKFGSQKRGKMTIFKEADGTNLTVKVEGRLDTMTAPQLEKEFKESLNGVTDLVIDFEKLDYISSAGLRVVLAAQKVMNKQGSMKLVHLNEGVREVFDITGFSDIMTIE